MSERNLLFQELLKEKLQQDLKINPSIVVYGPLSYEIAQQKSTLNSTQGISDVACFSDIEKSQKLLQNLY